MLQKSLRAAGIRFKNACKFWSGLGRGSGRAPWRNGGCRVGGQGVRSMAKPGLWPVAATWEEGRQGGGGGRWQAAEINDKEKVTIAAPGQF